MLSINELIDVELDGTPLTRATIYKSLGFYGERNDSMDTEESHRIQIAWFNWKCVSKVLCDQWISNKKKDLQNNPMRGLKQAQISVEA